LISIKTSVRPRWRRLAGIEKDIPKYHDVSFLEGAVSLYWYGSLATDSNVHGIATWLLPFVSFVLGFRSDWAGNPFLTQKSNLYPCDAVFSFWMGHLSGIMKGIRG
jgi:hypothetical protein